jgi:hypothetical protein
MCSFHGKLPRPTAGIAGDPRMPYPDKPPPTGHRLTGRVSAAWTVADVCLRWGCYPSLLSPLPSAQLSCSDGLPTRTAGPLDPNAVSGSTELCITRSPRPAPSAAATLLHHWCGTALHWNPRTSRAVVRTRVSRITAQRVAMITCLHSAAELPRRRSATLRL